MSQDGLMGKFDALMRKHRGGDMEPVEVQHGSAERPSPPADAWLPVLTDVVQRGSPRHAAEDAPPLPSIPMPAHEAVAAEQGLKLPLAEAAPETPVSVAPPVESVAVSESSLPQEAVQQMATETLDRQIAARLVDELTPKITDLMQEQVAEELRRSLNQSMANLMANLSANVEDIVRQAVAERLAAKDKKSS